MEMEIAAAAQARGERGQTASGAVEREGRKRRRRGQGQGQVRWQPGHAAAVLEDWDGRSSGLAESSSGGDGAHALSWRASGSGQTERHRLLIWQDCGGFVGQLYAQKPPASVRPSVRVAVRPPGKAQAEPGIDRAGGENSFPSGIFFIFNTFLN